jgi:hypothetical protein
MSRRNVQTAVVYGLAAFAAGGVVATAILQNLGVVYLVGILRPQESDTLQYVPAVLAVCAALVCYAIPQWLPRLAPTGGWVAVAIGSIGAFGVLQSDETALGVALAVGICLGGVLVVLGAGSAAPAVAGGLAGGLATAPMALWLAAWVFGDPSGWAISPIRLQLTVAAGLAVLAAVMTHVAEDTDPGDRGSVTGIVVVTVVAGLAVAAEAVRRAVAESVLETRTGQVSARRMDAVTTFNEVAFVGIAVGVAIVLAAYAYRRGKADAARWVCVAFGLAAPIALGLEVSFEYQPGASTLVLIVAAVAVAAGVLLTRYADRAAPWDALGVLLAAVGLLLVPGSVQEELGSSIPAKVLLGAGLGLGLGSGLGRLALPRTAPAGSGLAGSGLAGSTVSGSAPSGLVPRREIASTAALGFAAMVLAGYALAPVVTFPLTQPRYGRLPLTGPVVMAVTALVLVLLFGFGRLVDRVRRDIYAEAQRPPE